MTNEERTQRAKQIYEKLSVDESTAKLSEEIKAIFEEIIYYVNSVTNHQVNIFLNYSLKFL